jgi:hypothetical protein
MMTKGDVLIGKAFAYLDAEHPTVRDALREIERLRVDAERYQKWVSYSGFTKDHCDATLDAIQVNDLADAT